MPKKAKEYKFRIVVPETYLASYIVMARNEMDALERRAKGQGLEEFGSNKIPNLLFVGSETDPNKWKVEKVK